MTLQERIDDMYKQLETTKSKKKIRDLKRGIANAERERRRLKKGETIVI